MSFASSCLCCAKTDVGRNGRPDVPEDPVALLSMANHSPQVLTRCRLRAKLAVWPVVIGSGWPLIRPDRQRLHNNLKCFENGCETAH